MPLGALDTRHGCVIMASAPGVSLLPGQWGPVKGAEDAPPCAL